MKLLWYVHAKINRTRLNTLMKGKKFIRNDVKDVNTNLFAAIEPDYVSELYEALTKRVELGGAEPMQVEPSE
jgi:hypothetical protein